MTLIQTAKNHLPKDIYKKWVLNFKTQNPGSWRKMSLLHKRESAATAVFVAFKWARTPEGFSYWCDVYALLIFAKSTPEQDV